MKKIMIMAIAIIGFLSTIEAQDLDVVVGTNLNIGSDNTINPESNCGNAIGMYNEINSSNSIAVGYGNSTSLTSPCSAVFGSSNHLSGMGGFIAGYQNTTASSLGMAFGKRLKVTGSESILFGSGIESLHLELINDENSSFMVGFNSTKPTLFVAGVRNVGQNTELTGRIAIGDVPYAELSAKLHIRSDEGEDAGIILEPKDTEASNTFIQLRDEDHTLAVDNVGAMMLSSGDNPMALQASNLSLNATDVLTLNGKVGVNIENTYEGLNYAFAVSGGILADKVFIQQVDQWHDAVFSTDYKLMSLNDLKLFVQANHHLPEVPSEAEVLEQGYDMAEMQGILLKKIEELTLYILQQEERITELENELKAK